MSRPGLLERLRRRHAPGWTKRVLCALLALASAGLLGIAGFHASVHLLGGRAYAGLTEGVVRDRSGCPQPNWDELRATNPDVVAWVEIDGTSIALPVVAPCSHSVDWYLDHDLWGNWSTLGCLVLSCCPEEGLPAGRAVVFGHHLSGTSLMLSELAGAHQQPAFDSLGSCWWCEPDGTATRLSPICATLTHESDPLYLEPPRQRSPAEWLNEALAGASARSDTSPPDNPCRVVTFITCSSSLADQPERCAVTFAAAEQASACIPHPAVSYD